MKFIETKLKGAFIIDVDRITDERGFFGRSYCDSEFEAHGITARVKQTNVSYNKQKGTLRGMHMQLKPYQESKLVRCTRGRIYDVIIDMREGSPTFRKWLGVVLSPEDYRMLFVPEGFAHGFITLEDNTDVTYQVSESYAPGYERGYRWDDPAFDIHWPLNPTIISPKDQAHELISAASALNI